MESTFPLPDIDHPDFLAIDDLLDFSNEEDLLDNSCTSGASTGVAPPPPSSATITGPSASTSVNTVSVSVSVASSSSINPSSQTSSQQVDKIKPAPLNVFDSTDLCVPCDDIAELEWLSNFVEESFSSGENLSLQGCNSGFGKDQKPTKTGNSNNTTKNEPFQSTSPVSVLESNAMHSSRDIHKTMSSSALSFSPDSMSVPGRARSKRCRSAVCFWNSRILSAEASESILESSSTTSTITAASSDSDMFNAYYEEDEVEDDIDDDEDEDEYVDDQPFQYNHHVHKRDFATFGGKSKKCAKIYDGGSGGKSPMKKPKIKEDVGGPVRKCLHCATTKTPQWRAGPMGPKTLCNACGVRYKSGRLCPEYRPAASPTFNENLHSNSHRRVIEMRKQKGDPITNGNSSDSSHGHGQYSKLYYNNDNRVPASSARE